VKGRVVVVDDVRHPRPREQAFEDRREVGDELLLDDDDVVPRPAEKLPHPPEHAPRHLQHSATAGVVTVVKVAVFEQRAVGGVDALLLQDAFVLQ
jgi:hypothetical protein